MITLLQFGKLLIELTIEREQEENITARNLTDEQDKRFEILKCWWKRQENSEEAYVLLGDALVRAGLKHIAREILNYPPPIDKCRRSSVTHRNDNSLRTQPQMLVTPC